ncbi:MAG TPA: 1,2-phenylacetyl-CoA epoxidase subunit PaaE [Chitinophagaceae bacterium]|nr:1,2-phenylacetyl-CoA epoxidase subunit PaaE [Chitinophagaceae bacterium]
MIHFHPLKIKEIRQETDECVSILFEVPEELKEKFEFSQGQSLTMRADIGGEEIRRTYSICSSPLDKQWRVAVKKVDGGIFSSYANEKLKEGDIIEVMPPVGKFYTKLDKTNQKNYLAIAAGSGITPVLSIIKTTLITEPKSTFTLLFGNRSRTSIIFKEELDALKNRFMNRFNLLHILSREVTDAPIFHGRINKEKCDLLFERLVDVSSMDEIFICGPEEMIFTVKDLLEEKGIDKKHIHFELFTTPGEKSATHSQQTNQHTDTGRKSKIAVKLDGIMFDFELSQSGDTILDAALKQGADLPFACKGGVCCTCKARLIKGEVEMDVNYGLEEDEVAAGFILTCQSHPKTSEVIIDFDQR